MSTKASKGNNLLAEAVILYLSGLSGFDHWWDNVDEETQDDILRELQKVISQAIGHVEWKRLVDFAESFCLCPCCGETRKCHEECTYKEDAKPEKYELMIKAREALIEAGVL